MYVLFIKFNIHLKIEKLLETASNVKTNKVDVQNSVESATTMEANNENPLPGSNINTPAKPVGKLTTISRATVEEINVAPIFGTGKYSASLSTTAYGC